MLLIKMIKVGKSKYKRNDSNDWNCTAKKQISKMVLYHSTDLTWVQPYLAQQNSFIIATVDGLSHKWVESSWDFTLGTLCETTGRRISWSDYERLSVGTNHHNHQRIWFHRLWPIGEDDGNTGQHLMNLQYVESLLNFVTLINQIISFL